MEATRRAARRIWRQRGCPRGRDLEFWLEAEAEVAAVRVAAYYKWEAGGRCEGASVDHWLLAEAQAKLDAIQSVARRHRDLWETWSRSGCGTSVLNCYDAAA